MTSRRPVLHLVLVLLAAVLAPCATAQQPPPSADTEAPRATTPPAPTLRWQPYRFEPADSAGAESEAVDAEIGVLTVPENRESPTSRSIELHVVRFRSTAAPATSDRSATEHSTEDRRAPIVYLSGGPGGSGIEAARHARFPLFMALRAHADVLVLDQRGTGLSNAIPPCPFAEPWPLDKPWTRASLGPFLEREARRCGAQWRETGVDLDGYDTAQSADDLEDLRRALGVPKITLWGISYGTHLAFAMLDRHPESVDRVILASAEGPDETIKLPARTEAFLERLDARLDVDLVDNLRTALARLDEEPARVAIQAPDGTEGTVGIGRLDVQILLGYLLKNPETLQHLAPLSAAMAAGDFSHIAPFVAQLRSRFTGFDGMPEAMDAASSISDARREMVRTQRESVVLGDALNFPLLVDWPLATWLGIEPLPPSFRRAPSSDVPALFLSGSLDGRTYTESHRELAAGFPDATFVVVEGAGHDLFLSSPDVTDRMLDFLARGTTSDAPIHVPSFLDAPSSPR